MGDSSVSEPEEKRQYRVSGKVKLGGRELELYCGPADAAVLLEIPVRQVSHLCAVLGKEKQAGGIRITAADLYAMVKITKVMAEFECSARTAVKIAARLDEARKGQAAA